MRDISPYKNICPTDLKILVSISGYVIFLLFWISRNSYTHDLFATVDNSWYFTCGKAWMNGLVPYVDFADSKGPLLWLIYGMAYLISPFNYIGVFWFECLFYIVTLWFVYKTAMIFLKNERSALTAVFITSLFFFNSLHFETKTEDFCMPFITAGLYCILKLYYGYNRNILTTSFILGIGIAACLLMKYSIAIIYLAFVFAMIYYIAKYCKPSVTKIFVKSILSGIAGFLIVVLPFVIYFILNGGVNFMAFINEYFVKTYQTVHIPITKMLGDYFADELSRIVTFRKTTYSLFVFFILGGVLLFCLQHPIKSRFIPLLMAIWIIAVAARHNITYHYALAAAPFGVLTVLALSRLIRIPISDKTKPILTASLSAVIIISVWQHIWLRPNFFLNDSNDRKAYRNTTALIGKVKNPTYMSVVSLPMFDVPTNALPACRYWILQTGATDDMIRLRNEAIRNRKADFIIWADLPESMHPDSQKLLLKSGYKIAYSDTIADVLRNRIAYRLYVRNDIKL